MRTLLFILVLIYGVLVYQLGFALDPDMPGIYTFDYKDPKIDLDRVMAGGPVPDGIPALNDPKFELASDIDWLYAGDKVAYTTINGTTKAYPVRVLNWHEIVNDTVGGRKVVVVWCPLCGSAIAAQRTYKGETLDFGVSGLLYKSDVLMFDRATRSLWSQLEMRAVSGQYSGVQMETLPIFMTNWQEFKAQYPNALVLSKDTGYRRNYNMDPYEAYQYSDKLFFPVGHIDERLPLKQKVFGLKITKDNKLWALAVPLRNLDDVTGKSYTVEVGPVEVELAYQRPMGTVTASFKGEEGYKIDTAYAYWFAWAAFYPVTDIFEPKVNYLEQGREKLKSLKEGQTDERPIE